MRHCQCQSQGSYLTNQGFSLSVVGGIHFACQSKLCDAQTGLNDRGAQGSREVCHAGWVVWFLKLARSLFKMLPSDLQQRSNEHQWLPASVHHVPWARYSLIFLLVFSDLIGGNRLSVGELLPFDVIWDTNSYYKLFKWTQFRKLILFCFHDPSYKIHHIRSII